ncbi:MAG: amidohydrolase family protein [Ilumatobacteraceae bacterium]
MDIDYPAFDADNHYYEALDAFTRHLDPKLGPRCVQWATIDGRQYHVVGGKVSRAVINPTFDPIAKAGAMHEYFRGNPDGKSPLEFLKDREPIPAHYREPAARLEVMDRQGLEKIWLFPTLGMLYEEVLKDDSEAVTLTFTAFNRWLEEDWGFARQDRIFAAPYISLCDVDWAVRELEWALDKGARVVVMRPAAPTTATGQRSPFHTSFDPFWARVNEAGIPVVVHAGDSGYNSQGYADDRFAASFGGGWAPSIRTLAIERAAFDFLITSVFEGAFTRFPNLRIASIENGSDFLGDLFKKLRSTAKKMPGWAKEDPVETYRRNIWMNPFWEDDPYEIVEWMGADRVLFGSDWPHIEGMPQPLDYLNELKEFDDDTIRKIVRDNAAELNTPRPV